MFEMLVFIFGVYAFTFGNVRLPWKSAQLAKVLISKLRFPFMELVRVLLGRVAQYVLLPYWTER